METAIKEEIINGIVWEIWPVRKQGGQQAGIAPIGYKLSHPEFQFEVSCCEYRQSFTNRQMCLDLFELFLLQRLK